MTAVKNPFRECLESGETTFGSWLGLPDNSVAEIMAGAGFDWLLVDHEHAPFELRDVLSHLQVLAGYDVAPVVRPASGDPVLLKKLADIGAQSFIVPMIDTPAEAAAVVAALRYPPDGQRGLGTSLARAARWNGRPGYAQSANDGMCIIVQAETATAMGQIDAIAATPGVDGVFIGPSDLSASMGHLGKPGHPDVEKAITDGLAAIRATGKHAGLLCLNPARIPHYVDCGANFIGVAVDTLLLGNAARGLVSSLKNAPDDGPASY